MADARTSESNAITAKKQAEANLHIALRAFDEISDNLASRELPKSIQIGAAEGATLPPVSGLSSADAKLVQSLLKFYDEFARNNAGDTVVDFSIARVHQKVGAIYIRLGHYGAAVDAFERALQVVPDKVDNVDAESALTEFRAKTLNALGTAHLLGGGFARAIESHEQALAQLTSAQRAAGSDSLYRYELAITINHLVRARAAEFVSRQTRRGPRRPNQETKVVSPPEIDAEYQQAHTILAELLAESPGNVEFRRALAHCHRSVLPVAWANGDERLASTAKQESVTILRNLADEYADNAQYQFDLADTLAMTKYADSGTPLSKNDVEGLQESVALANQLHKKFSTALEYTVLLANTHHKLASYFIAAKSWSDAEPNLTATVGLFESLVASSPSHPLFQVELARVRWKIGEGRRRQGSLEDSRQILEKAISDYVEYRNTESGRRSSVGLLVGFYRQLAGTLEQLGESDLATKATEAAEELRRSGQ